MSRISRHPNEKVVENKVHKILIDSIKDINQTEDVVSFLNDLLTPAERIMVAKRIAVAYLLLQNKYTYQEVSKAVRVSFGTIAKINAVLALQGKGFRKVLGKKVLSKSVRNALAEFSEVLVPFPPKGVNRGNWYRQRREAKQEREKIL